MEQNKLTLISQIKTNVRQKYPDMSYDEVGECFDRAVMDYLLIRYPSSNGRPDVKDLQFDFVVVNWVIARMCDIIERGVNFNVSSYSENGLSIRFDGSYIDPNLACMILPKAGVPK